MIAVLHASQLQGTVTAAASKSGMQRACALAFLNNGSTLIKNPGNSEDVLAALEIIRQLGATLTQNGDGSITVLSNGKPVVSGMIDCNESGLSLRMFTAIAALGDSVIRLGGKGSLLKRPVGFYDSVLPQLHVSISSNNGLPPITVCGPMEPADISIDSSSSSQYLTGILLAFAKATRQSVVVEVQQLKSKPYIDLTLQMLEHFGYDVRQTSPSTFQVNPVPPRERHIVYEVESDWSGSAFLLVAGALAGDVNVKGLDIHSAQGDKAILDVLALAGADLSVDEGRIRVTNTLPLRPFDFDATHYPDLFPPLVALAASCPGISTIRGVSRLAAKESDRAASLKDVFSRMNVNIQTETDTMTILGSTAVTGADVYAHQDHRIAMACAVAALNATSAMRIEGAESVNKSYPAFFDHLKLLGASVSLTGNTTSS